MSKATQQEIRSLYRSYLRIVKEWPEDKIRLNRGMKQILSKRVEETFRTGQEKDTLDLSKQHRELEALEFLLDNKFKDKRTYQYKILVVGDLGTGKTSILRRYVQETFSTHYKSTIGVDFALKVIQHESDIMVHLQLWDIAGQERFGNMTRVYCKGAVGAFVVYDVTRPKTFENVIKWKVDIDSKVQLVDGGGIPTILLANKIDQQENSKSKHELDQFCLDNGFIQWQVTE
ncbi:rab32, member RAS oncoprotein [Helicostylum pulchrum]|uniref:Ras-related protein Rab n=1 Tax=Helicostylum pulchrum TaxID=562976 RepID=A0ABP9XY08_9FUNG